MYFYRVLVLCVEIFLDKLWEKFRGPWPDWPPISPPVVSVFAVDASFHAFAPNRGDAVDIICSSVNIFGRILSDVLTVQI